MQNEVQHYAPGTWWNHRICISEFSVYLFIIDAVTHAQPIHATCIHRCFFTEWMQRNVYFGSISHCTQVDQTTWTVSCSYNECTFGASLAKMTKGNLILSQVINKLLSWRIFYSVDFLHLTILHLTKLCDIGWCYKNRNKNINVVCVVQD